ncbi:MAG: hypothetical protein LBL75_04060 [Rickettsiales bacterium]|jgi:hypothetical protein|nr:hypothetical protein [Rickettsiales bacterium]
MNYTTAYHNLNLDVNQPEQKISDWLVNITKMRKILKTSDYAAESLDFLLNHDSKSNVYYIKKDSFTEHKLRNMWEGQNGIRANLDIYLKAEVRDSFKYTKNYMIGAGISAIGAVFMRDELWKIWLGLLSLLGVSLTIVDVVSYLYNKKQVYDFNRLKKFVAKKSNSNR